MDAAHKIELVICIHIRAHMDLMPTDIIPAIAAGAPAVFLTCRRFAALLDNQHIKYDTMIASGYSISITRCDISWTKNDNYHRLDGPACEHCCSPSVTKCVYCRYGPHKMWFKNGRRHREGGPAYIGNDLSIWYKDGHRHRDDGPAEVYADGTTGYYIMGKRYEPHEFEIMTAALWVTKNLFACFM